MSAHSSEVLMEHDGIVSILHDIRVLHHGKKYRKRLLARKNQSRGNTMKILSYCFLSWKSREQSSIRLSSHLRVKIFLNSFIVYSLMTSWIIPEGKYENENLNEIYVSSLAVSGKESIHRSLLLRRGFFISLCMVSRDHSMYQSLGLSQCTSSLREVYNHRAHTSHGVISYS